MKKENLNDFTFIMPVRLDSIDRLENILLSVNFLSENFQTKIEVLETAPYNNKLLKNLLGSNINYTFIEDSDNIFYRTKYLNYMSKLVITDHLSIWDADVIISKNQIQKAVELIRNKVADFVYPYNTFLDTSLILKKIYIKDNNIETFENNVSKMKALYLPAPVGGAFLANLNSYILAGMENENFYGWGFEDGERYYRWETLGYKISRIPGPLFHLTHERGLNSQFHNSDQRITKKKEVINTIINKPIRFQ